MLTEKEHEFQPRLVNLEMLVPHDNFYRQLESKLDLSFVRDLVRHLYKPLGRPSIDPVVFFKLQLIMFFEDIRSERQLMTMVNMRLDCRWFLGYDLTEKVPDHSSLSRIRDRYGLDVFQRFFEHIVELCKAAGLVWGKELYFDGTKVEANADIDKRIPRFHWEAQQHLHSLFVEDANEPKPNEQARSLVEKYDGHRIVSSRTHTTQVRKADTHVCPTDPDATPLFSQPGHSRLGYNLHYVVDGGEARIILASLVTPGSIQDQTPMLDLERWTRFRWNIAPKMAVADTKYGSLPNIVGLEQDGLKAYLGLPNHSRRSKLFSYEHFDYDAQQDHHVCPAGQTLPRSSYDHHTESYIYRTSAKICQICRIKAQCTTSSYARMVKRSIHQEYIDQVREYHKTEVYKKAQRKRSVWIEPIFGEAKQWHQGRRFRLRRLSKVNIEGLIRAAGQNIKRLLKQTNRKLTPDPAHSMALRAIQLFFGDRFAWHDIFCIPSFLSDNKVLWTFSTR